MKNVKRKVNFSQVCVWQGVTLGGATTKEFERFLLLESGVRIQYLETILTGPDLTRDGDPVPGTGGRSDIFFAVHDKDIPKFSLERFRVGVKWLEDLISEANGGNKLYPERVKEYKTW